jgi:SAM-dependent methyltransferase
MDHMDVDEHYADARLASIYDWNNPSTRDQAFYRRLAAGEPKRILDLGCGTGRLATELASDGHAVIGVDPAAAMLEVARTREGGELVRWTQGDAQTLDVGGSFDMIVMYGHVFQVFLTDDDLHAVLTNARRHLSPRRRLAFETRNPLAREWDEWNLDDSAERVEVPGDTGPVDVVYEVTKEELPFVTFEARFRFVGSGETLVSTSTLRFWSRDEVERHLDDAGLEPIEWLGDFDGSPISDAAPEIIVISAPRADRPEGDSDAERA